MRPQLVQNRHCAIRGLETCNVELPLFGAFALSKDDQMVGPRQLSHHWCDFLVPVIGSAELPHAEQVRSGATVQSRLCSGDTLQELLPDAVAPFRSFDLAADRCAYQSEGLTATNMIQ